MVDLNVSESISSAGNWIAKNEGLLIQYAVNIVAAILILIVGSIIARLISNGVARLMRARGIDETVNHFLAAMLRYAILAFTFIAVLGRLGVQTTSVIAVMGAAGLAVGLALQGSLSNFAAGVLIVAFRPFKAGEFVQVGAVSGTVDNVQIFSTTLRTPDNKTIIVPNGKIISSEIINYSREPSRRVDITVGVGYNADIDQVKSVLGAVVEADPRIMKSKDITIRLNEMAPSSLNFVVRVWTKNSDYWSVYFDLMENFKKTLDANNIGIPFPQMDVHLHTIAKNTVSSD